jgi:HD-like signal output (HDOD) protein
MNEAYSVSEILLTMADAEAAQVRRLLAGGIRIPAQPRVLTDLRQLMQRQEHDVRRLARVINQDPGLAAMLFRLVGAGAYRQHPRFESVDQILQVIGVEQTFNLVQAIAIAIAGAGDIRRNRAVYEAFWARSQAVGQLAMLIADERVAVCNIFPDQAYLAGIFHDCGVPLLMQRFPSYCAEMKLGVAGRWTDLATEDRKYNADHCVVGYLVARHWRLPGFICDAIRYHHLIREPGLEEARTMAAILQLAIEFYHRVHYGENDEWALIQADVLGELGLAEEGLPEFVDIVLERFHAAAGDAPG